MAVMRPVELSVRWDLSVGPDGISKLALSGELDADSTPAAWRHLESELAGIKVVTLEIDVRQLVCDSAGLAFALLPFDGPDDPRRKRAR